MKEFNKKTFHFKETVWFLPLVILLIWGFYKNRYAPLADFSNYYFGALFQAKNQSGAWIYDPVVFNTAIEKAGFKGVFASYSPNPPFISILFLPLTFFSPFAAKIIFNILGGLLLIGFLLRWLHLFSIDKRWALLIPILFFRPILANIYQGQIYFYLLILLVEGYIFLKNGQYIWASLLWTIAILIKIFPIILFLYLVCTRKFKTIFILAGFLVAFLFISIIFQGVGIWMEFLTKILPKAADGEVIDNYAISFQSWNVFFRYLFVPDEIANSNPIYNNEYAYQIAILAIKAFILSLSAHFIIRSKDDFRSFAIIISCGLLLTPAGSVYSLMVGLVLFLNIISTPSVKYLVFFQLSILFLVCNIPFHTFLSLPLLLRFSRLFLLFILWASFISRKDFSWVYLAVFVFLLTPLQIKKITFLKKDTSVYFPVDQKQIMITRFSVENQKLVFSYWDDHGLNKKMTDYKISKFDNQSVSVENNILFYHQTPLLESADEKKNPVLINENYIVYLSDKNRGPGFYALRMIKIHEP